MDVYLARQPIYSTDKTPSAYELLYRENAANAYSTDLDGSQTTRQVITQALFMFDLDKLTQNKPAFVNFTRDLIMQKVPMLLNPQSFTIEILEDVPLDKPLIERLTELKQAGFTLALDDYEGTPIPEEAIGLIDIIKVDFLLTTREMQKNIAKTFLPMGKKLLAEKVETQQDYEEAARLGYELFQGYYFSKPIVLKNKGKDIASTSYFKLMQELSAKEINYKKLSAIFHTDAHLTYHLLKKMSTLQYYRAHSTHSAQSVQMALVRMGESEIRRWITLLLMRNMMGEDMDELIRIGLIRAVFCECLAKNLPGDFGDSAFTIGMFSVISSENTEFLDILQTLQIADDLQGALQGSNQLGALLTLAKLYEDGQWSELKALFKDKFPDSAIPNLSAMYMAAVNYADSVFLAKE